MRSEFPRKESRFKSDEGARAKCSKWAAQCHARCAFRRPYGHYWKNGPGRKVSVCMRRFEMPFWHGRIGPHDLPDPGRHNQRFYGAYSNRARVSRSSAVGDRAGSATKAGAEQDNADFSREARSTWARLLRKIFEVDLSFAKTPAAWKRLIFCGHDSNDFTAATCRPVRGAGAH